MPTASLRFDLPDAPATEAMGAALARAFPGSSVGGVVHLRGDLGSGKTTCARSLLHALGVTAIVRSPTYTLVDTYSAGELTCVHVDLYRLQTLNEVDELGLRDLLGPGHLMLIEWPEKGGSATPPADLQLQLTYRGDSRAARLVGLSAVGLHWVSNLSTDNRLLPYVSNIT